MASRLILDIDGVICNFVQGMLEHIEEAGGETDYCCWKDLDVYNFFSGEEWAGVKHNSSFWVNLKRLPGVRKTMIVNGIFPDLYLTARPIDTAITSEWIQRNQLPTARVVTVVTPLDKIQYLEPGDVFVDDHPATVRAAQEKGVIALLMSAPFHRGLDPTELKDLALINSLEQVAEFIN